MSKRKKTIKIPNDTNLKILIKKKVRQSKSFNNITNISNGSGDEDANCDNKIKKNKKHILEDQNKNYCTICGIKIYKISGEKAKSHPILNVLICKKCYCYYKCITSNQMNNCQNSQCIWCGDYGLMLPCNTCQNSVCFNCLYRNLGGKKVNKIKKLKRNWSCFSCDPKPIKFLIDKCKKVMNTSSIINQVISTPNCEHIHSENINQVLIKCPNAVEEILSKTHDVLAKLKQNSVDILDRLNQLKKSSGEFENSSKLALAAEADKLLMLFKKAAEKCHLLAIKRLMEKNIADNNGYSLEINKKFNNEISTLITSDSNSGDDSNHNTNIRRIQVENNNNKKFQTEEGENTNEEQSYFTDNESEFDNIVNEEVNLKNVENLLKHKVNERCSILQTEEGESTNEEHSYLTDNESDFDNIVNEEVNLKNAEHLLKRKIDERCSTLNEDKKNIHINTNEMKIIYDRVMNSSDDDDNDNDSFCSGIFIGKDCFKNNLTSNTENNNYEDDSVSLSSDSDVNDIISKNLKQKNNYSLKTKTLLHTDDETDENKKIQVIKRLYDPLLNLPINDVNSNKQKKQSHITKKNEIKKCKIKLVRIPLNCDNSICFSKNKNEKVRKKSANLSSSSSIVSSIDTDEITCSRKRNCTIEEVSGNEIEEVGFKNASGKRRRIKSIIEEQNLEISTKEAGKLEKERRLRVKERQALYNSVVVTEDVIGKFPITTKLILDPPDIAVHPKLICCLKPHQVDAVKFLWDCVCESSERVLNGNLGSGAILAHCMGLGKTLSVITFLHTVMRVEKFNFRRCIISCPLNTVLNWKNEWKEWQKVFEDNNLCINIFEISKLKKNADRFQQIENWFRTGGVLIVGYETLKRLIKNKFKDNGCYKETAIKCLLNPGPDIFVADEGHILKNNDTILSQCILKIKTKRKIILTGTPLQNNLKEYYCMVNIVKPKLLGTRKEFHNRFINPIINGQCADSTVHDVTLMKRRSHVLYTTLSGCIQRLDYRTLVQHLPPKQEYVIYVQLTSLQIKLYSNYLLKEKRVGTLSSASLFRDFHFLYRICSHPWHLKMNEIKNMKSKKVNSLKKFLNKDNLKFQTVTNVSKLNDDDDDCLLVEDENVPINNKSEKDEVVIPKTSENLVPETTQLTNNNEWWKEYINDEVKDCVEESNKIIIVCRIISLCESIGDKLIIFSQSLFTLNYIEHVLKLWNKASIEREENSDFLNRVSGGVKAKWRNNYDYFRFDGSTPVHQRNEQSILFNDEKNPRARLFLISTKAGGLGINLIGANRVIILDASWNPSNDLQSIFRVYRFGQTKPCYIYRFLAYGTMEQKIYERQITKLSLAHRVVDEQQIDRHYTSADLQELYKFKPIPDVEPTPPVPKDRLLADIISEMKHCIVDLKEHDSLLEERPEEGLTDEDRKAAWEEYEQEKEGVRTALTVASMEQSLKNNQLLNDNDRAKLLDFDFHKKIHNYLSINGNKNEAEKLKLMKSYNKLMSMNHERFTQVNQNVQGLNFHNNYPRPTFKPLGLELETPSILQSNYPQPYVPQLNFDQYSKSILPNVNDQFNMPSEYQNMYNT